MKKPVSFEIAKLLKEKGFDEPTKRFYPKPKCKLFGIDEHGRYYPIINKTQTYFIDKAAVLKEENSYKAPTIAKVVRWLYKKYGIWISPYIIADSYFSYCIINSKDRTLENTKSNWLSLKEAYSQAIEYTLKNLI